MSLANVPWGALTVHMARNERLRTLMHQKGVTLDELASACEVIPKSVERWISQDRIPHAKHRRATVRLLEVDEGYLWPGLEGKQSTSQAPQTELLQMHQNRASVPREVWLSLLGSATESIDVLVFSGTFFAQTNPHVARMLKARAEAGAQVRLCFGNPKGNAVAIRGREEGIGETLAAKIRASLTYYRSLIDTPGCEVRLHDTTLYNSLFRYDDNLLVNPHIWGQPASANPVMQLRRMSSTGWFDHYQGSFEAVWKTAVNWDPDTEE